MGGIQKWRIPCNWKFLAENFCGDSYHNNYIRYSDPAGMTEQDEHNLRNLYRRWAEFMEAQSWDELATWRNGEPATMRAIA